MHLDPGVGATTEGKARRVVTWTMFVALGVLWGLFALWAFNLYEARRQTMEQVLDRQRAAVAEHVSGIFTTAETFLVAANRWIADHPDRDPRTDDDFATLVRDLQGVTNKAMTFRLVDEDGNLSLIPATTPFTPANVADRDYFVGAMSKQPGAITISAPYKGRATGHVAIAVATKLLAHSHGLVVANVAIEVKLLEEAFAKARITEDGVITLMLRDGRLLVRSTAGQMELGGKDLSQSMLFTQGVARANEGVMVVDSSMTDRVPRLLAFGTLKAYPLVVAIGVTMDGILAETLTTVSRVGVILLLGSALLLLSRWKIVSLLDDLAESEAHLRQLVATDPLTGLFNRRHFNERAEYAFRRATRLGEHLAVLMLDVDHFKTVNDTWGHATGDFALKSLAATLKEAERSIDVLSRYGGEEFAVLLPGTDAEGAVEVAERLRMAVKGMKVLSETGEPIPMSISIGVAALAITDKDFSGLLSRADAALYRAKAKGRDRVEVAPV